MTQDHPTSLKDAITQRELQVWNALVEGDQAADAAALDETFLGVYADGFAGKADHVGQLADGPTVRHFALSEIAVRPLGPDHALIAYRADFARASSDTTEVMFVSSIWQRAGAGWVNIFSQDTPACP